MTGLEWMEPAATREGNPIDQPQTAAGPGVVERWPWRSFAAFSAFYFVVVFSLSSMKLLWLDELITVHLAQLGSLSAIWHALARGADPNPPLTYLLVHLSTKIFGAHEFAYRLPATIGYWIGLVSLFAYLRRALPATWALAGTILSTTMAAFEYSYESRSYGMFYGFTMLAVFCWSCAVDPALRGPRRWMALAGMTVALAACISTNYFAVLAFLPLVAGEITRTILRAYDLFKSHKYKSLPENHRQSLDIAVWMAFAVAALPLLFYRPLIEHSIAQFQPYAWNKVSWGQVEDSYTEMVEMVLYPALTFFAFAICLRLMNAATARLCPNCRMRVLPRWLAPLVARSSDALAVPIHEAVAVFFLMAYPILGYLIASIRGGMLSPRFVIPVCFGFAIGITLIAFQLFRQFRPAGVSLLCIALAWLICRESYVGYWYEEQKQCFYKVIDRLPLAESSVPPGAPIVVSDPLMALTFQYYAPKDVAHREVFPVDFPAIRFFRHDDSPEENLWAGRGILYTLPIAPLADFHNSAGEYLIVASDGNWLLSDLAMHHFKSERLDINTRAGAIGGFTPLAHGTPAFYIGFGGEAPRDAASGSDLEVSPIPFRTIDNLPSARSYKVREAAE